MPDAFEVPPPALEAHSPRRFADFANFADSPISTIRQEDAVLLRSRKIRRDLQMRKY
jgi:hypothetical protein